MPISPFFRSKIAAGAFLVRDSIAPKTFDASELAFVQKNATFRMVLPCLTKKARTGLDRRPAHTGVPTITISKCFILAATGLILAGFCR